MRIAVVYYARLREEAGCSEEVVETAAASAAELYAELARRHRFSLGRERLRVAVNDELVPWTTVLADGDGVVFIPPVAGG